MEENNILVKNSRFPLKSVFSCATCFGMNNPPLNIKVTLKVLRIVIKKHPPVGRMFLN
jgi:hypothetical protein